MFPVNKYGWLSSWKEATPYEAEDIFGFPWFRGTCLRLRAQTYTNSAGISYFHRNAARQVCLMKCHTRKVIIRNQSLCWWYIITRWWFQIFLIFVPTCGKWSNLTSIFFQMGWNHEVDSKSPPAYVPMDAAYPMTDGRPLLGFYAPAWSRGWGGLLKRKKGGP